MRFILVAATLIGCGPQWEVQTLTDEGTACLVGDADGTGTVHVDAGICLSSSCDRDATMSCEATLDGTTITVTNDASWEAATGNVACTDDCGFLGTTCEVGPLPAGEYTVVLGDSSTTATIPTTGDCTPF